MQFPMPRKNFFLFALSLCVATAFLLLSSCGEKKHEEGSGHRTEDEVLSPTWEDVLIDSIAREEQVGRQCADLCLAVERATDELNRVLSPDALISAKKRYYAAATLWENTQASLSSEERESVRARMAEAERAYTRACRKYELPANGIIANLSAMIRQVDKVESSSDLLRFEEGRLGVLRELDDIHLCVEQGDRGVSEVKKLAQRLKNKYEAKKKAAKQH